MNKSNSYSSANVGIYTLPETARISGVPVSRIRRWIAGYKGDNQIPRPALWRGQHAPIAGKIALGFLDLVEIRFVYEFIQAGVSWHTMHIAREIASKRLETDHPFCTNSFVTDGKYVIEKVAEESGDPKFIEIIKNQREFKSILEPFLKELEFGENNRLIRWWPMGRGHHVVIDPSRNFGHPTLATAGVPTAILAKSVRANRGEISEVARWYEVTPDEVREAVEFESSRKAA